MFGLISKRAANEESGRRARAAFDSGALWASDLSRIFVEQAILNWQRPGEESSTARYVLDRDLRARAEEVPDD